MIGVFKNAGSRWQPEGVPEEVRVYDFINPERVKAAPNSVYDAVKKSLLPDFHARHPGGSRGPARLSDCFYGYQRKVLDSGFRPNDGLGGVYPFIHSLYVLTIRLGECQY